MIMEMQEDARTLTVINHGEDDLDAEVQTRITMAPHHIQTVIASVDYVKKFGRDLKKVNVIYMDGGMIELFVSDLDLTSIERAVGTYFLPN